MPSQTAGKNLPYPLGTDRVMDGDDQIRKLAQSVDNMAQAGTATPNITTGGTAATVAVTFPVAYASTPSVAISYNLSANANISCSVQSPTASGFIAAAVRATAGTVPCYWIAVGPITPVS